MEEESTFYFEDTDVAVKNFISENTFPYYNKYGEWVDVPLTELFGEE
jgi:hypothetical protein